MPFINGIVQRFGWPFQDARLLNASAAHPMFGLAYIPSEKKADVVSNLKAVVNVPQTQSQSEMARTQVMTMMKSLHLSHH